MQYQNILIRDLGDDVMTFMMTLDLGAFFGASLTKNVPINLLLILIGLIISYESFTLLKDNIKNRNALIYKCFSQA